MDAKPLFTIIMLTFNRPQFLKEAVSRFFAQTYNQSEIICIINNASTPETQEYLSVLERQDSRIRLVHFKTNQYDPADPLKYIGICFNAALNVAKGDYVFYQEDDDLISADYVERMVALFGKIRTYDGRGPPCNVNVKGELLPWPRVSNFRPRYMPGHLMAIDTLRDGASVLFSAPGTIFWIKRDVLIKAGGYYPLVESSQLYGMCPST